MTKKAIALFIFLFALIFMRTYFICLIIAIIFLLTREKKTPKIEQKPQKRRIPEQETFNRDEFQATLAEVENLIDENRQIRAEADLRQFINRNDVTKEELAEYMFNQRRWDGVYERHVQMEEISKVCNITPNDIEWVEESLKGKCCIVRSEEARAILDYQKEQSRLENEKIIRETMSRLQREKDILDIYDDDVKQMMLDSSYDLINFCKENLKKCDYDTWLKEHGYGQNY